MALNTFVRTLAATGLPGAFSVRGLAVLPLLARRGLHPTLLLPMHALNFPDKPAMRDAYADRTYAEFKRRVCQLATALHARGAAYHDPILIMVPNSVAFLEAMFACTTGGFTSVLVPTRSTAEELGFLAADSGARWLIADARYGDTIASADLPTIPPKHRLIVHGDAPHGWETIENVLASGRDELPPLPPSGRIHNVIYTSGTTGKPKGAKRNMAKAGLGPVIDFVQCVPLKHSDRHLVCCPLYHSTGMGMAQIHLLLGASLVIMEKFKAEEWLAMVHEHRPTTATLVPTMIHDLITLPDDVFNRYDVSSIRVIVTSGAPLTLQQRRKVRERFGDVLYDMYGSTEWGWITIAQPRDHVERPGTIGRLVPGVEVKILDENLQPIQPGEVGELFGKTRIQIEEYHNNEAATEKAMVDGFLSVGDMVRQDEDGYFYIADRKSDMVISGGVNLYPPEIEGVLSLHPSIADIAIVGIPDERWGEKLLAWVVTKPGAHVTEDEIVEFAKGKLSGQKVPRLFRFVDQIPKSPTGKIRKRELKQRYLAECERGNAPT